MLTIRKNQNPTIVKTTGEIVKVGSKDDGLLIQNEDGIPVMYLGEVSDNSVINLFLEIDKDAGVMELCDWSEDQGEINLSWEILINRQS